MKNIKLKSISTRLLKIIVCLCMVLCVFAMGACNSDTSDETSTEAQETDTLIEAVRVIKAVKAGERIGSDALETVSFRKQDLPFNVVGSKSDVEGKYARVDLYVGDFITPAKLSNSSNDIEDSKSEFDNNIEYTLITKYSDLVSGNDYTEAIKKAIAENPNGTIYFPDGTYEISDTIIIPADNSKIVSFRLSNYATIKAVNWSEKTKPMIRIGVYEDGADREVADKAEFDARNVYIMGGMFDANSMASGIVVEGNRGIMLENLTVKNSFIGVHFTADNSVYATFSDVENVNIIGTRENGSIGLLVESTYNTFTNMKISDVQYGVKCTENGSNNTFRSLNAIGTGVEGTDNAGFWDMSAGNQYDICYSDQYATGFLIDERTRSIYNACVCSWWSAENNYHVGFRAVGKFNSNISYCKVTHKDNVATDAYILVDTDGGEGFIYYPINQVVSDKYLNVLKKYCDTDILN